MSYLPRCRPAVQELEPRQLLAGFQPTALEQVLLERLNDARANPAAYGAAIGVNLAGVAPSQPLAFNTQLIQAARLHALDMNNRGFFAHVNPSGQGPGERLTAAGFSWTSFGESIAAGYPSPESALAALIIDDGVADLGHRRHLLAIDGPARNQSQVGIGVVQNGSGPFRNYYAIDTATSGDTRPFLTGVVFDDFNRNGRYDAGEGLGGITISVAGVGTTTTFGSGGYNFQLSPGTYTVTAAGLGLPAPVTQTVTVGPTNVRLNFNPSLSAGGVPVVRNLYQAVLGRAAADAELPFWLPVLQTAGGLRLAADGIERSAEARTRLVKDWYRTYLGREAVGGEEQSAVNALLRGLREEQVLAAILGSPEYAARAAALTGTAASDTAYVQALYLQVLGRPGSAAEVNGWVGRLAVLGRAVTAEAFLASAEHRTNQVVGYYRRLLLRQADPAPAEVAGWVRSSLDLTGLRVAFASSAEFASRP
jgi:uncharacterized protein YkwD